MMFQRLFFVDEYKKILDYIYDVNRKLRSHWGTTNANEHNQKWVFVDCTKKDWKALMEYVKPKFYNALELE